MGSSYRANSTFTIDERDVRKVIPREFQALEDILETYQVTWEELACAEQDDHTIDEVEEGGAESVIQAWKKAQEAFNKKINLTLYIGYHNSSEKGSIYDGVDGVYFSLDIGEIFNWSPAAKKLVDDGITPEFIQWVTNG